MNEEQRREFLSHVKNASDSSLFDAQEDLYDSMTSTDEVEQPCRHARFEERYTMVVAEIQQRGLIYGGN